MEKYRFTPGQENPRVNPEQQVEAETFLHQLRSTLSEVPFEIEKTPEMQEWIATAIRLVDQYMKKMGFDGFSVDPNRIHTVSKIELEKKDRDLSGYAVIINNEAVIVDNAVFDEKVYGDFFDKSIIEESFLDTIGEYFDELYGQDKKTDAEFNEFVDSEIERIYDLRRKFAMMETIIHELVHLAAQERLLIEEQKNSDDMLATLSSSGLDVVAKNKFKLLNEAIVQTIAEEILTGFITDQKKELDPYDADEFYMTVAYAREMRLVNKILESLAQYSGVSEIDLWRTIKQDYFNGSYKTIAKINKIYGPQALKTLADLTPWPTTLAHHNDAESAIFNFFSTPTVLNNSKKY